MLPTDNPWPAMIVLASGAAICLIQGNAQRNRKYVALGIVFALLGVGCFLLDMLVRTPREAIIQNLYELTSAFQKQDVQKTLSFFSQKAAERAIVEKALHAVHVGDDLRITDVSVTLKAADSLAMSHFRANATLSLPLVGNVGHHTSRWELDWQREAGEWKVIKVHRLHPISGRELDPFSPQ